MQDYIPRPADINGKILPFSVMQYDSESRKVYMTLSNANNPTKKNPDLTGNEIKVYFLLPDNSIESIAGEVLDPPESGKIAFTVPSSVTQQIGKVRCQITIFGPKNSEGQYTESLSLRIFDISVIESICNGETIATVDNADTTE